MYYEDNCPTCPVHRPVRCRFPTLHVLVFHIDKEWVANLVEMQPLECWNCVMGYLLTFIVVLSKYAWVAPLKSKAGKAVTATFKDML